MGIHFYYMQVSLIVMPNKMKSTKVQTLGTGHAIVYMK